MRLSRYLAGLGYGTRREVELAMSHGRVTRRGSAITPSADDEWTHEEVRFDGEPLDPPPGSLLMLHKPAGYVCSTRDAGRLIYELLPERFLARSPIMASVGRLDMESSGLLLLTDDGRLSHRIRSPRAQLHKVYEVDLAEPLRGDEAGIFASGTLLLRGEDAPLLPARLEVLGERRARVTISEGRYHQVRRMFAALGNRVEALHRSRIGALALGDLAPGEWRALETTQIDLLLGKGRMERGSDGAE